MKLVNYFAMMAIYFALFVISQVDASTLEEFLECKKLLKEHRKYSHPLSPISSRFGHSHAFPNNRSESLAEIERKQDFIFLLTIHEFKHEIEQWRIEVLACPISISSACSNETTRRAIGIQSYQVSSLELYYTSRANEAKPNRTEVYEQMEKDKKMLADIETTQMDLCASGDSKCQECVEKTADELFTKGFGCNTFRQWHLIKYRPIQYSRCNDMKQWLL